MLIATLVAHATLPPLSLLALQVEATGGFGLKDNALDRERRTPRGVCQATSAPFTAWPAVGISRALTQAEERVGVRLFERVARGVVPPAAGVTLIAGALRLLGASRELERLLSAPLAPPTCMRIVRGRSCNPAVPTHRGDHRCGTRGHGHRYSFGVNGEQLLGELRSALQALSHRAAAPALAHRVSTQRE